MRVDSPWVFRARSPFTVLLFVLVDLVHELLELQVLRHQLLPLFLAQLVLDDQLYWIHVLVRNVTFVRGPFT